MFTIDYMTQFFSVGRKVFVAAREGRLLRTVSAYYRQRRNAMFWGVAGLAWQDERRIAWARKRLRTFGLQIRAERELREYAASPKATLRNAALWELAIWHADEATPDGARKAYEFLSEIPLRAVPARNRIPLTIMQAECLLLLGKRDAAVRLLETVAVKGAELSAQADLELALANVQTYAEARLRHVNRAFRYFGISPVECDAGQEGDLFDRLPGGSKGTTEKGPLVSVIIPVFNSEFSIKTTLTSLLEQTWQDLEVLVVDDCSTDGTVKAVRQYQNRDSRIRLIQLKSNGGPYVARNEGLRVATGEFVTCHDADDWSHPQKIAIQARHLMRSPKVIANTSQQVRATPNLVFHRRGKPGGYLFQNMSSLMFRRLGVIKEIGFWDAVRFGADTEFIRRLRLVFGEQAVQPLLTGPLSFQRQASGSLTTNSKFGFPGFFMGARNEYRESFNDYYRTGASLYFPHPQRDRLFPVPRPMLPEVHRDGLDASEFDVVIASDFRLDGGSTLSSLEEIKAQAQAGLKTGLIQLYRYDYPANKPINHRVRELMRQGLAEMIVYGQSVRCRTLAIRYPPALAHEQVYVPSVEAGTIRVIVNQTPMSRYGETGEVRYNPSDVQRNVFQLFGKQAVWHPIGPLVRQTLHEHHSEQLKGVVIAEENWVNIIDVKQWQRTSHLPRPGRLVVGRHSRDSVEKWPQKAEVIRAAYPDSDGVDVRILGGADSAVQVLGGQPRNWTVYRFGEMEAPEFLAQLDVFIYYTHPDLVEAFGRVILEAMAVGVPVILPPSFRVVFEDAAIYAEPEDAISCAKALAEDPNAYRAQVEKALAYVIQKFDYATHTRRVMGIV